jgi:hypothetical protein
MNGAKLRSFGLFFCREGVCVEEGCYGSQPKVQTWKSSCMNLVPFIRPEAAKKALLDWPLRAKDLRSGNLENAKPQCPMAKDQDCFQAAENHAKHILQNQINTSLEIPVSGQ